MNAWELKNSFLYFFLSYTELFFYVMQNENVMLLM